MEDIQENTNKQSNNSQQTVSTSQPQTGYPVAKSE